MGTREEKEQWGRKKPSFVKVVQFMCVCMYLPLYIHVPINGINCTSTLLPVMYYNRAEVSAPDMKLCHCCTCLDVTCSQPTTQTMATVEGRYLEFQVSDTNIPRQPGGRPLVAAYHGNYLVVRYTDGPPSKKKVKRSCFTRFITVPHSLTH